MSTDATHRGGWQIAWPLLLCVAAAIVNASTFIMGYRPSPLGTIASLVAILAWPVVAGWPTAAARRRIIRVSVVFWALVVLVPSAVLWVSEAAPRLNESPAGILAPLLLLVFMAPFYGVYALLPAWEQAVQVASVGVIGMLTTLAVHLISRRLRGD